MWKKLWRWIVDAILDKITPDIKPPAK